MRAGETKRKIRKKRDGEEVVGEAGRRSQGGTVTNGKGGKGAQNSHGKNPVSRTNPQSYS